MPMNCTTTAGGTGYSNVFVGPVDHVEHIKIDISGLTMDEVDVDGYLKPGVPFDNTALAVLVASGKPVFGVVIEPTKLPVTTPTTLAILQAHTNDCFVAVATHGIVNRDLAEDNLGRAYTAHEIAGFPLAGSNLRLTRT